MALRPSLDSTHRLIDPVWATVAVLAAALAAWLVTFARMRGMDDGPGTDLGSAGWYVGVWVTMMTAMMLPSAAPIVRLYARVSHENGRSATPTIAFVSSYLVVWGAVGVIAYGVYEAVTAVGAGPLAWDRAGPYVAGTAVAAAGLYELTPLKRVCLRHCRSPLSFLLGGWRQGFGGAVRMGSVHGMYCVGCCSGLMLILFAVGVMSLFWMILIASVVFAEKLLPGGERLSRGAGIAFVALGLWIATAPATVPWLTDPGSPASMMSMS